MSEAELIAPPAPTPTPPTPTKRVRKPVGHATLAEAFLAAQMNVRVIEKTKFEGDRDTAAFAGATIDVVLDVIVPALNAEGLSLHQPVRFVTYGDKSAVCVVDTIITHARTGQVMKDEGLPVCSSILPSKEQGARLTYSRKQAALSMMGIAPRDGDPHHAASGANPPPLAATSSKTDAHLLLIEGSGLIYRAYHACPALVRESDGAHVGAVVGFVAMLQRLIERMRAEYGPTHAAVIFDAGRRTFRNTLSPDYKANRPPTPADLSSQMPIIREACKALGVAWTEAVGFEADDLIATYARHATNAGASVTIVSPDKDMMQLVGPSVRLFDPLNDRVVTPALVLEKLGVAPERVTDAQALIGDVADNVPGAPGIGPVAASDLLERFGTLEGILARLDEVEPKRRAAIEPNATSLLLSKQLVTLRTDVPVAAKGCHPGLPSAWPSFEVADTDVDRLEAFMAELGPHAPVAARPEREITREIVAESEADNPKLCAELMLRAGKAKRSADLRTVEAELAERTDKMSAAQIALVRGAIDTKTKAITGKGK